MFSMFKPNPTKTLRKAYLKKTEDAMLAQRKGDIRSYSTLTAEAEAMWKEIQEIEAQQNKQ